MLNLQFNSLVESLYLTRMPSQRGAALAPEDVNCSFRGSAVYPPGYLTPGNLSETSSRWNV